MKFSKNIRRTLSTVGTLGSLLLSCAQEKGITMPPIEEPNSAPEIHMLDTYTCNENEPHRNPINAEDKNGDTMTFDFNGPNWLKISGNVIYGICPEVSEDQTFEVEARASDYNHTTTHKYDLIVKDTDKQDLTKTHLLSESELNNVSSVGKNYITFSSPVSFEEGTILGSGIHGNAENGIFTKVTSVSEDGMTVNTERGTIEEVVDQANLSYSGTLNPSNIQYSNSMSGITLEPTGENNEFNFNVAVQNLVLDKDGDPSTTNDRATFNGHMNFTPNFDVNVNFNNGLESLTFITNTNLDTDLTVSSNGLYIGEVLSKTVATYHLTPFIVGFIPTFPVPMPLVVSPTVSLKGYVNPTNANPLSLRVQQDGNLEAGIVYENGSLDAISSVNNNFTFSNPVSSGNFEIEAFLAPEIALEFYGLAGPRARLGAGLGLEIDRDSLKLSGKLEAFVGVGMDVIGGVTASIGKNVLEYEKLLFSKATEDTTGTGSDSTFTDSRDGQIYGLVKTGNQTWFDKDLSYADPSSITVSPSYGRFYNLETIGNVCPAEFHVPTQNDWNTLFDTFGGVGDPTTGGKLKSTGPEWESTNTEATNESGLGFLPSGYVLDGVHNQEGRSSHSWTYIDNNTNNTARASVLKNNSGFAGNTQSWSVPNSNNVYMTLRCMKDGN